MNKPPITYLPPSEKQIEQFAREVCEKLAQSGNAQYLQPEVVGGLTDFLAFVGELLAQALNDGHTELLDKRNA
jgi:hypothetical protein